MTGRTSSLAYNLWKPFNFHIASVRRTLSGILNFKNWMMIWLGSNRGIVVRALPSHQCGPGSIPKSDAICGLNLLLVLSLAPRGFSLGTPVFPSPQKPTFPNSNSTRHQVDEEPLCGCASSKSLFILFIFYILRFYTISEYNEQWVALLSMHPFNISRTDTDFGYLSRLW